MQRPIRLLVPIGRVTTTWARLPDGVATVGDDLGLWQGCGCCDPSAGVGSILPWTEHRVALLAQRFGPELYNNRLLGTTRCSRYSLHFSDFLGLVIARFIWSHFPYQSHVMIPGHYRGTHRWPV